MAARVSEVWAQMESKHNDPSTWKKIVDYSRGWPQGPRGRGDLHAAGPRPAFDDLLGEGKWQEHGTAHRCVALRSQGSTNQHSAHRRLAHGRAAPHAHSRGPDGRSSRSCSSPIWAQATAGPACAGLAQSRRPSDEEHPLLRRGLFRTAAPDGHRPQGQPLRRGSGRDRRPDPLPLLPRTLTVPPNTGSKVRIITNNCIALRDPWTLDRENVDDYTPYELAIVRASRK